MIACPKDLAGSRVESVSVPHRTVCEGPAVDDRDRRPGTECVVDVAIHAGVGVRPERFTGGAIEAAYTLLGRGFVDAIREVNAITGDRRTAVAGADRGGPDRLQLGAGEFLDDAGLTPDAIALRPAPLRPIVGRERRRAAHQERGENEGSEQSER